MDKVIQNGEIVLIFDKNSRYLESLDLYQFMKGVVVGSRQSDNLALYGSPKYMQIYSVISEDGREYTATNGEFAFANYYILTINEYIEHLKNKLSENNNMMIKIEKKNSKILEILDFMLDIKVDNILGTKIEDKSKKLIKK